MERTAEQEAFTQQVIARTQAQYAALQPFDDSFKESDIKAMHELAHWYFAARNAKRFNVSDTLRKELAERGVVVELLDEEIYHTRGLLVNKLTESRHHRIKRLTPKKKKK